MVKLVEMKRTVMPSDIIVNLLCVGTADDKIQIFASCLSIGERKGKTQGRVAGRYNDIMGMNGVLFVVFFELHGTQGIDE